MKNNAMRGVGVFLLVGLLFQPGCATARNFTATGRVLPSTSLSNQTMETTLVFLLSCEDETRISASQWQVFMDDYITPRFGNMLLVRDGYTQYWPRKGDFIQSPVKEVVLYHDETKTAQAAIDYIRTSYRLQFNTPPVLKTVRPVNVSYEEEEIAAPVIRIIGEITSKKIKESSGLAYSTRNGNLLWTHNDSGDKPRFFALNRKGKIQQKFNLEGAKARDWEDMCSFRMHDISYLLFADVGDNDFNRNHYTLYMVEEPVVDAKRSGYEDIPIHRAIQFTYEDGAHNCEAVAVDTRTEMVYLISKDWGWKCHVYAFSLQAGDTPVAQRIAGIGFPLVTAMDISRDGSRMIVLTYGDAYEFRRVDEDWPEALSRDPYPVPMPKRRQGEAICYGPDPQTLYLTSEKLPAPLWEVVVPGY